MRLLRLSLLASLLLAACGGDKSAPSAPEPPTPVVPGPPEPPPPPPPPPKATSLSVEGGEGQSAAPNEAVPTAPRVLVRDDKGQPMSGVKVIFEVEGGGGRVTGDTVPTGTNGMASPVSWKLGPLPGPNSLLATVPELTFVRITATAKYAMVTEMVKGSVSLPAGSQLVASALRVNSTILDVPVAANGSFDAIHDSRGVELANVTAPNGNVILFAWLTGSPLTMSARTTAQVLAFFDLAAFLAPDAERSRVVRDFLATQADLSQLEAAITTVLKSAPATMSLTAPAVITARKATVQRLSALARAAAKPATVFINPSAIKSGIQVDEIGFSTLTITNNWRRRVAAFVDRVSYLPKGGGPSLNSIKRGDAIRIASVTPITSLMSTAIDVIFGNYAGTPVLSSPQPVPLFPVDALSTKYRVTVVGPGGKRSSVPLTDVQKNAQFRAAFDTILLDIIVPLLDQALTVASFRAGGPSKGEEFVSKVLDLNPTAVYQAIEAGDFPGALSEMLKLLFDSSAGQNLIHEVWLVPEAAERGLKDIQALDKRFGRQQKALAIIEVIATTIAAASAFVDLMAATPAEQWDVDVSGARIAMNPSVANISNLDIKTFTATVLDATGTDPKPVFGYKWSTTGNYGNLCVATSNMGNNYCGTSFESSREEVSYSPRVLKEGTDDINVEVYVVEAGGRHTIGSTTAKITTYAAKVSLLPANVSIQPTQSTTFTATVDAPLLTGGTLSYRWTTPGKFGNFGSAGVSTESSSKTITYTAFENEGTDAVTVEAFSTKNGVKQSLGTAGGSVEVKKQKPTKVMGSWFITEPVPLDPGRSCVNAYLTFPVVPDAKSYEVYAYGFNDTLFWGREFRRTFIPPFNTWGPCTIAGYSVQGQIGGEFRYLLSGGAGPNSGIAAGIAALNSRFSGMVVEVTVKY